MNSGAQSTSVSVLSAKVGQANYNVMITWRPNEDESMVFAKSTPLLCSNLAQSFYRCREDKDKAKCSSFLQQYQACRQVNKDINPVTRASKACVAM